MRAYAKVNIFLKIVGKRECYHEIVSRFVLVNTLFDELEFVEKTVENEFELQGEFGCALEDNTLYKAYEATCKAGYEEELKAFFSKNALHVTKNIPSFAGLGGGSSDAATFLHMVNQELNLKLDEQKLAEIGLHVGADVPFFIYGYSSANVSGIGEVVEEFNEPQLHVKVCTPDIKCDTGKVYASFREHYKIDSELANKMKNMSSKELLKNYDDISLNDLLEAAVRVNSELEDHRKKGWFFSGSGSSFFKVVENG
jgi:4-diphosphocytidyl-2-C-methyl-D-erythritol kinase